MLFQAKQRAPSDAALVRRDRTGPFTLTRNRKRSYKPGDLVYGTVTERSSWEWVTVTLLLMGVATCGRPAHGHFQVQGAGVGTIDLFALPCSQVIKTGTQLGIASLLPGDNSPRQAFVRTSRLINMPTRQQLFVNSPAPESTDNPYSIRQSKSTKSGSIPFNAAGTKTYMNYTPYELFDGTSKGFYRNVYKALLGPCCQPPGEWPLG